MEKFDEILLKLGQLESNQANIKEALKELKADFKGLSQELAKKGEEIKDCFYVADMSRNKTEELIENFEQCQKGKNCFINNFSERFKEMEADLLSIRKDLLDGTKSVQEAKDKRKVFWLQSLVTISAILYGILAHFGVI